MMATYVYCPRPSNGALELVKALGAVRLRRFDGMDFWDHRERARKRIKLVEGDVIVCWGASVPDLDGIKVLNSAKAPISKKDEIEALIENGIPTVTMYLPVASYKNNPALLPRKAHHIGGGDLLVRPENPDYYVVKDLFVNEYRIHSFNNRSIRAGVKVPREGFKIVAEKDWRPNSNMLHPWIRSFDGGWKVAYDGFVSTQKMRTLAHKAVGALKLTFGAVDIGDIGIAGLKVLEVNRAPGIEGNSIATYARAITKWVDGKEDKDDAL